MLHCVEWLIVTGVMNDRTAIIFRVKQSVLRSVYIAEDLNIPISTYLFLH